MVGAVAGVLLAPGGLAPQEAPPSSPSWAFPRSGPPRALYHEPVFGIGPHTTWRGGWGVELEVESEGGEVVVPVEVLYGVTEELTVTAVLPFANPTRGGSLGEVGLRAKWRFATRFAEGRMDALGVVAGVTLPRSAVPGRGRGGPVLMAGVAAGRESRRWYYFAGARGIVRLSDGDRDPGDRGAVNLAWGVRPWLTGYLAPDLVLLVEANGRAEGRTTVAGEVRPESGGRVVSVAPAFLLSYRNVMLKGGVDLPVWEDLRAPGRSAEARLVGALEIHF